MGLHLLRRAKRDPFSDAVRSLYPAVPSRARSFEWIAPMPTRWASTGPILWVPKTHPGILIRRFTVVIGIVATPIPRSHSTPDELVHS